MKLLKKFNPKFFLFASITYCFGLSFDFNKKYILAYNTTSADKINGKQLPMISRREVMNHCTIDKRIWVTFGDGVYDVTDFANVHPGGGEKIMMVAGGALDPFWEMYSFHKKQEVLDLLNKYRIGNLDPKDILTKDSIPNYDKLKIEEIWRSPYLSTLLSFPFCAECPTEKLLEQFYTPNEYFFIRNHNLVPVINKEKYKLKIADSFSGQKIKLSLDELKSKYERKREETIIMCSGNRRSQMNKPDKPKGLSWNVGAISNGIWEGASLRDVLSELGYNKLNSKGVHLIAEGLDKDMQGVYFSISIPLDTVFDDDVDVLLAYSYNGSDIPYEHGFPIRLVIPGFVGVRNVKWLKSLEISHLESSGAFQQRDYKIIPKDVDWEKVDLSALPPLMKYNLNSAIVNPAAGGIIIKGESFKISGWAIGNGGSVIKNVEISIDGGLTWQRVDSMKANINSKNKSYGWTLWEYNLNTNNLNIGEISIMVRAEDEDGNTQPSKCEDIWNVRGLMNNSTHEVNVYVKLL
jgi:sulfite oxidase